ncbi:hypothetical protein [Luteolibacter marinus]|uniref:hypothetical protein n=1 Tax=Luteolibacter marinus TaxID=2776705 RepID=UPI0018670D88|nr:hypothetical protein [Luteolibacter marinus]
MTRLCLPADYPRIRRVGSFDELVNTPFADGVNALCWERPLAGDFGEVVEALAAGEGITSLDESTLRALPVGAAGKAAVGIMLKDMKMLEHCGLMPELNCIRNYLRDDEPGVVRTDVYSFHADRATVEADTYLCTYHGPASEILRNEEARRHIDIPATRAALLEEYDGDDDEGFAEYLAELCYDLHYAAAPQAKPIGLGLGNLWRIAVAYPGCPVPPCVHRAPDNLPGLPPRLLLIS